MSRRVHRLLGYRFTRVDSFEVERNPDRTPCRYMPQDRYARAKTTPLNPFGSGPFCRLRVRGLPASPGVYVLFVEAAPVYVGRAQDLMERWGPRNYGMISPRNCYVGGQSTNCRINSSVLKAAEAGARLELYFHETDDCVACERELLRRLAPSWNIRKG